MTSDELPTPAMATTGLRWHVYCKSCQFSAETDFAKLIRDARGDIPLVRLKLRCGNCGSRLTDAVMDRAHMGPKKG
jgi:hypothetical protein